MKSFLEPQISQINADGDVADNSSSISSLSLNHLRPSAPSAVKLLQSEGDE